MFRNFRFLPFALLSLTGNAQQGTTIDDYLPMNHHNNGDLLFNSTSVNPALSIDSLRFRCKTLIQEQWMGFGDSPAEINLSAQAGIPGTMHTAGIEYEWWGNNSVRNQLIRLNYSYKHVINPISFITGGINFDFSSLRLDEAFNAALEEPAESYFFPDIDLGICYTRKRQTIGLAYNGIINNSLDGTRKDYELAESGLLLNYSSWTRVGSLLKFHSGTVLETDFTRINYYLMTSFTVKDMITGGIFYNSIHTAKGFFVHAIFIKVIEIGYQFHFDIKDDLLLGGHTFYLGYRLK